MIDRWGDTALLCTTLLPWTSTLLPRRPSCSYPSAPTRVRQRKPTPPLLTSEVKSNLTLSDRIHKPKFLCIRYLFAKQVSTSLAWPIYA